MKQIYTNIDIGSDTIKVICSELSHGKLNLLAATSVKSKGIKKGLITDVNAASLKLKQAILEIESMLGIKIRKTIASVPSYFAEFFLIKGELNIPVDEFGNPKTVDGSDIFKVLQEAVKSKPTPGKEMVTVMPIDFIVDEVTGIKDPKGMLVSKLGVRAIMVTTPNKNIYSVLSLIEGIGIEVVDISINSIGDMYAFKTKDMLDKIGAVINIGSEITEVSIYNKGIIVKNAIIQMGGKNIENDLSYIYKIDIEDAIKIKEKFALAHKNQASVNDFYEVKNIYDEMLKLNQYEVSEVVASRLEEILNLVKTELATMTNRELEYVIVTGGTSNIMNFNYIIDDILGKNAIIGNVKMLGVRNNKYSSSIGNILYFIERVNLKGREYSMFNKTEQEDLASVKKNVINVSNDSMLGKVFGYFFGE